MFRLGLKLWSVNTDAYLREAERLFAAGVFSYVELFVVPETLETLAAWRRLHDAKGVPFVVHNAHAAKGFNLADPSAETRNREIYAQTRDSPTVTSIHDHWKNHSLDQMDLCWQSNVSDF